MRMLKLRPGLLKFKRELHDEEAGPSHGWPEDEPQPKRLKND